MKAIENKRDNGNTHHQKTNRMKVIQNKGDKGNTHHKRINGMR